MTNQSLKSYSDVTLVGATLTLANDTKSTILTQGQISDNTQLQLFSGSSSPSKITLAPSSISLTGTAFTIGTTNTYFNEAVTFSESPTFPATLSLSSDLVLTNQKSITIAYSDDKKTQLSCRSDGRLACSSSIHATRFYGNVTGDVTGNLDGCVNCGNNNYYKFYVGNQMPGAASSNTICFIYR